MESENNLATIKPSFSFYVGFGFKLVALGLLFSLIPLIFVNLPLRMLFTAFPEPIYNLIMFGLSGIAIFVCFGLAAKLLFSWGVSGYKFQIIQANLEP